MTNDELGQLTSAVWRAAVMGSLPERLAGQLADLIGDVQRGKEARPVKRPFWAMARKPAQPRSRDRVASQARRRRMAAAGPLPPQLAHHFTEGERAALMIVAREVAGKGTCTLPMGRIAAEAGISLTLARRALKAAAKVGLLTIVERKRKGLPNLTNVVRIVSAEWLLWISKGRVHIRGGHDQTSISQRWRAGGLALEREQGRTSEAIGSNDRAKRRRTEGRARIDSAA